MNVLAMVSVIMLSSVGLPPEPGDAANLHAAFDTLLVRYVTDDGVRYDAWAASPDDMERLSDYVDHLETIHAAELDAKSALAYWINLYNAVTLELVLAHYPVDSIKDTGGFLKSPWEKKLVSIDGTDLSLNGIENDVIRRRFPDARVHFALNCASLGCPPLAREAFRGPRLDEQLDAACARALGNPRWVRVEGDRLVVSRIFDWYKSDFERDSGSVAKFISRYRDDVDAAAGDIRYADYDWSLNLSR